VIGVFIILDVLVKTDDEKSDVLLVRRCIGRFVTIARTYCELSRKFPARTLRGQIRRKASWLASHLDGHPAALLLPLSGHCRDVERTRRETFRRISYRLVRAHRATVSRDSAQFSASYWRAVKTLF
jgi:hypothetical protein